MINLCNNLFQKFLLPLNRKNTTRVWEIPPFRFHSEISYDHCSEIYEEKEEGKPNCRREQRVCSL